MRTFFKPLSFILAASSLSIVCSAMADLSDVPDKPVSPALLKKRTQFLKQLMEIATAQNHNYLLSIYDFNKYCPNLSAFKKVMKDRDFDNIYGCTTPHDQKHFCVKNINLFVNDFTGPCTKNGLTPFSIGATVFIGRYAKPFADGTNKFFIPEAKYLTTTAFKPQRFNQAQELLEAILLDNRYNLQRKTINNQRYIVGNRADLVKATADAARKMHVTADEYKNLKSQ